MTEALEIIDNYKRRALSAEKKLKQIKQLCEENDFLNIMDEILQIIGE